MWRGIQGGGGESVRFQDQEPEIYDCLRTCVASIFDLDRLTVPNFGYGAIEKGHGPSSDEYTLLQTNEREKWFLDRGMGPLLIIVNDDGLPRPVSPWGICIAIGPGGRGYGHAVIWDADWWSRDQSSTYGKLIHDPHPEGNGLEKVEGWVCFALIDPGAMGVWG